MQDYGSTLIRLAQVSKIYGSDETRVQALSNIDLTIQQGELCAIVGSSGSGKSTLINIVGCLDRPSSGYYYLNGSNTAWMNDAELARVRNAKIGFVFQQFYLLPCLTVLENVMLPLVYGGTNDATPRRERSIRALEQVGIGNKLHYKPTQLSGGQQQRVAIARAIVNQPGLIIADEPTGALDSKTTQKILDIFKQLNDSNVTVIIVTHELSVARQCHRVIRVQDGRIE